MFRFPGNTTKGSEEAVKFSAELRPSKMRKVSAGGCWCQTIYSGQQEGPAVQWFWKGWALGWAFMIRTSAPVSTAKMYRFITFKLKMKPKHPSEISMGFPQAWNAEKRLPVQESERIDWQVVCLSLQLPIAFLLPTNFLRAFGACLFPDCAARVPVSLCGSGGGSGGEAVFAKSCVCGCNRRQPFATVCVSALRLSRVASAPGRVWKVCQVHSWPRSYIGVCRRGVSVSGLCCRDYFGVWRGKVCVNALCRRSYVGVCRGGVCVTDLCRRNYIGVCRGGVFASDLLRRSYFSVCRGGVCVPVCALCRRRYFDGCRGSVSVSDLCQVSASYKNVKRECPTRVSSKSVLQERQVRVSCKSVLQKCQVRVSYMSVKWECLKRVSSKSVPEECLTRVSSKSVLQECQVRVSYKSVK